jgi:S1-C subfamily serine protease
MRNGSGFLVTPAGHVVTARHVVEDCPQLTVRWPDQSEVAGVPVHLAADRDLAVIRIAGPVATWAGLAAGAPGPGTPVTVAGYPMRGRMTVRPVEVTGAVAGDLRIDGLSGVKMALGLRVHPGLSGGPVAGPDGRVVGVVIAMLDRSAVFQEHGQLPPATAFAEPLADVQALLGAAGVVLPVAAGGGAGGSGQAALAAATVRIDCGADPNRG